MHLVHFSKEPLGEITSVPEQRPHMKPSGLWVSDEAAEDGWAKWCEAENFQLDRLTHAHDVKLAADANIIFLKSAQDIDEFTAEYPAPVRGKDGSILGLKTMNLYCAWDKVAQKHQGIIITPYIWERRLCLLEGVTDCSWYYGWDCASGCIWDAAAIESVKIIEKEAA